MKRNVFLHIGLPKTGTTSIQRFFHRNLKFYRERGLQYYLCEIGGANAGGIAALILRPEVMTCDPKQIIRTRDHLSDFLKHSRDVDVLISGEAISYLRTDQECVRLKDLFPAHDNNLIIILTLRDKDAFWESYSNQIRKMGHTGTEFENSRYFLHKEGWLTDFETLTQILRNNFHDVRIVQYQENMVRHFCEFLGFPMPEMSGEPRLNQRAQTFLGIWYHRIVVNFYVRYLMATWIGKLKRRLFARP